MPSKNPAQRLSDIVDNIRAIREFTADLTLQGFRHDRKTVYAVVRALEIISEASRRLPEEWKHRHSEINWRAVAGAGNVYRHEYDAVDEELLWRTIHEDLPGLERAACQGLIELS